MPSCDSSCKDSNSSCTIINRLTHVVSDAFVGCTALFLDDFVDILFICCDLVDIKYGLIFGCICVILLVLSASSLIWVVANLLHTHFLVGWTLHVQSKTCRVMFHRLASCFFFLPEVFWLFIAQLLHGFAYAFVSIIMRGCVSHHPKHQDIRGNRR